MTGPLRHLLISREFPPASYPPGGIGTYAAHIVRLLADAGETVHVIGERWAGAPEPQEKLYGGNVVVHRVSLGKQPSQARELGLLSGSGSGHRFAWQAGLLAERLILQEGIDLVEAQEWEAPLYYFLLRRALGLGPDRRPPCVVHLHSPTELIYRHNEWTGRTDFLTAARLEEFCIRQADAWMCPSRYLARQAADRYRIPVEAISVMPYPQGDATFIPREPAVWQHGSVLYVGRLEPRKGVIEFVDAAVATARSDPAVSFDFVGDDVGYPGTLTVRRYMESRIPRTLRRRFRFHEVQPRHRVRELLAAARLVVVPSRWENFPNTCIEAMSSGLPVLASPDGGMTEMLEDGVTGWIAESQAPPDLGAALRRALAAPPDQAAAMGRAAAESIRGLCGNEITTRRHLARRHEIAKAGVREIGVAPATGTPRPPDIRRQGLGIVIQAEEGSTSSAAIDSIDALRTRPKAVAQLGAREAGSVSALSRTFRSLIDADAVAVVALVPASVALEPGFVEACEAALDRSPRLGILSGWTDRGPQAFGQPGPAFPYQWMADGIGDTAVVRADAFLQSGGLRDVLPLRYARWDLWNAIMVAGWTALAYPEVLATRETGAVARMPVGTDPELVGALRARFPKEFAADAETVRALHAIPGAEGRPRPRDVFRLPLRQQIALVFQAVRRPRRTLGWLIGHWSRRSR